MNTPLALSRRDTIEARLAGGQAVTAAALATEFDVSEDAIRRDLRALAAEGKCRKVYGGALPIRAISTPLAERISQGSGPKQALALAAVALIQPGEFLFLDCGSTNLALVDMLPAGQGLSLATNSIDIAAAVMRRGDLPLVLVGGSVAPEVGGSVDAAAVAAVAQMNIDRTFIGACALAVRGGLSVHVHADAIFKRAVLARSRTAAALVTSDKLGTQAPFGVGQAAAVPVLVVTHDADAADLEALGGAGYTITRAEAPQ